MVEYSIAHKDPVEVIGYNGEGRIKYNITGFNREYLEIKVERRKRWNDKEHTWEIDLDIPRYGRNTEQEPSNIKVAKYMRAAMAEAILEMENLEKVIPIMERHFQRGEVEREQKRVAEAAERQAKIDADKPVGEKLAKTICEAMVKQARASETQESKEIVFKTRGEHKEQKMRCMFTYSKLTLFNIGWNRVSKKDAIRYLADAWLNSVDTGDIKDNIPDARLAKFMMGGVAK